MPSPASSADARRQRRRQLLPPSSSAATPTSTSSGSSSSSSSSASPGALSSSLFSPAPSPFHHRFLSPLRSSAVPFSWEHRPGIPKTPARAGSSNSKPAAKALPLPPSLLSSKVVVGAASAGGDDYSLVPYDDANTATRRRRGGRKGRHQQHRPRRPPALAVTLTDWLAVLSLYRSSCTRSRDCLAATPPPRPRSPTTKAATAAA